MTSPVTRLTGSVSLEGCGVKAAAMWLLSTFLVGFCW